MAKSSWLTLGLLFIAIPASAQGVTMADLNGATIQLGAVFQEKIIRNGQTMYPKLHFTGQVTVAGNTITANAQATSVLPDGRTKVGAARSGTHTIGMPGKSAQGDDTVWVFSNGSLTRLRVHRAGGAGGSKMTISFRRGPGGLLCNLSFPMARETGVGEIRKDAAVDDAPIKILEYKQISSSCQVAKRS